MQRIIHKHGSRIWAQDLPVNLGMQAGKRSRFSPPGTYGPLETTLVQFNAWLLDAYRAPTVRRADRRTEPMPSCASG